jgi:hypothetical protein
LVICGKKNHSIPSRKHKKVKSSIFTHISYLLLSWAGPLGGGVGGRVGEEENEDRKWFFVKGAGNLPKKCKKMRAQMHLFGFFL